uniref:Uncharacterized protein n=1 Tax=Arundo donax TaxID=35708 RepID=A0A0A9TVT8_ARUDO
MESKDVLRATERERERERERVLFQVMQKVGPVQ